MNKNLKFRAWDGQRFHEWGYLPLSSYLPDIVPNKDYLIFVSPPAPHYVSQQFVTNINGIDLYIGDIIKSSNQTLHFLAHNIVSGGGVILAPCTRNTYNYSGRSIRFLKEEFHNFQVVGNIFENPELIEKQ